MKRKKFFLFFLFVLFFAQLTMGQGLKNTFEAKAGWGLYQGYTVGVNYFYTQKLDIGFGLGSYFGSSPFGEKDHYCVQLENTLHFGSETIQHVGGFYFNQQIMYWEMGDDERWKTITFGLNLGKTIGISQKLGIDLEVGPAFNVVQDVEKDPMDPSVGWLWPVTLNGRIQLTYKFN